MLNKEAKVQGIAIYAEFAKPGETMQIVLTPDAYTNAGSLVSMALVRRIVTPATPKKQWKITNINLNEVKELVSAGNKLADADKETFTEKRMKYASHYFDQIKNFGWSLVEKPILIEMSRYDADDISKGKTPNKLLYRVGISRTALGFPAEII